MLQILILGYQLEKERKKKAGMEIFGEKSKNHTSFCYHCNLALSIVADIFSLQFSVRCANFGEKK